jgi:DNA-directed RNA polymerase alpha subunit
MTISQLVKKLRAAESAAREAADAAEEAVRAAGAAEMSIQELNLSVRARNVMSRAGVSTVAGLVSLSCHDLVANKIGVTSLNEIREKLAQFGLRLRGDDWQL